MVIIKANQPLSTKVSVKDFKSRFTGSEMRAIDQAAIEDDDVYRYDKLVDSVANVDLRDPVTASGLAHLTSLGILTPEREKEILRIRYGN